jgi:hypothetical protein
LLRGIIASSKISNAVLEDIEILIILSQ